VKRTHKFFPMLLVAVAALMPSAFAAASIECQDVFADASEISLSPAQSDALSLLREIDLVLAKPPQMSIDTQVTEVIENRVLPVLGGLSGEIRNRQDFALAAVRGDSGKHAIETVVALQKEIKDLRDLTAQDATVSTKVKKLIPGLIDRQVSARSKSVAERRRYADQILKEIDRDAATLKDLEVSVYEKMQALEHTIDVMKILRDELQSKLWSAQEQNDQRQFQALKNAVEASEAHLTDLAALVQINESLKTSIRATMIQNQTAKTNLIRVAKSTLDAVEVSAEGRLDLRAMERQQSGRSADELDQPTTEAQKRRVWFFKRKLKRMPLEEVYQQLEGSTDKFYFKILEARILSQKSFSFEEAKLIMEKTREIYVTDEGVNGSVSVYEKAPFQYIRTPLEGAVNVAFKIATVSVRWPLQLVGRIALGQRYVISPSLRLKFHVLEHLDAKQINENQLKEIESVFFPKEMYHYYPSEAATYSRNGILFMNEFDRTFGVYHAAFKKTKDRLDRSWVRQKLERAMQKN